MRLFFFFEIADRDISAIWKVIIKYNGAHKKGIWLLLSVKNQEIRNLSNKVGLKNSCSLGKQEE